MRALRDTPYGPACGALRPGSTSSDFGAGSGSAFRRYLSAFKRFIPSSIVVIRTTKSMFVFLKFTPYTLRTRRTHGFRPIPVHLQVEHRQRHRGRLWSLGRQLHGSIAGERAHGKLSAISTHLQLTG